MVPRNPAVCNSKIVMYCEVFFIVTKKLPVITYSSQENVWRTLPKKNYNEILKAVETWLLCYDN